MAKTIAMRCEDVIQRLFAYLDGDLPGDDHARIQNHLEACRDCCSRAEFELLLKSRLAELNTETPPPSLRRRLRHLLDSF